MLYIKKANANLRVLFGEKHREITLSEIQSVYSRNVLSVNSDAKTRKGYGKGYLTGILYLAPSNISGFNTCPFASDGCKQACLFTAGRGAFYSVTRARVVKTLAYLLDSKRFFETIKESIKSLERKAKSLDMIPCVRLNGTSDIAFERISDIFQSFPGIQFYDYTAIPKRMDHGVSNYHLTFSLKEDNHETAWEVLRNGHNVSAVFSDDIPARYNHFPVIVGDSDDLRFLDQRGVIVALKAKGRAKKDQSGFVIRFNRSQMVA
jgi:hypothetical protein